jgi:hypothetical protein
MKIYLLLVLALLLLSFNQNTAYAQQPSIVLKGVQDKYKSLDEVKPVLVNESDVSIYLLPEDCGEPILWLHYMNRNWVQGIGKGCYGDDTAKEIKPGESYQIPALVWRPLITREGKLIERKSFPGRYIIIVRYSLRPTSIRPSKPWLKFKGEKKGIFDVSKGFMIVQ